MDQAEALQLLGRGRERMNEWNQRRARGEPVPDLTGVKLSGAELRYAEFRNICLANANLSGANFGVADTECPELNATVLDHCDLQQANLTGANLNNAILVGANLNGTVVTGANFRRAVLAGAKMVGTTADAYFYKANLTNFDGRFTDFSGAVITRAAPWRFTQYSSASIEREDTRRRLLVLLEWLFTRITWQEVRSVGSLQVLTKASYFALVFVPILAATWRILRSYIARYNLGVASIADRIEQIAGEAHEVVKTISNSKNIPVGQRQILIDHFEQLRHITDHLLAYVGDATLDVRLPSAWAQAFFAALFVFLGHLIYQVRAPSLVKNKTADDFAEQVLAGFSEGARDRNDRLRRAIMNLQDLALLRPDHRHANLVKRHGQIVWIPSNMEWFEDPIPLTELPADDHPQGEKVEGDLDNKTQTPAVRLPPRPIILGSERMRIAIDEGARAEYEIAARRARLSANFAFLLYVVAALFLLKLIVLQSWAVGQAAGWWG